MDPLAKAAGAVGPNQQVRRESRLPAVFSSDVQAQWYTERRGRGVPRRANKIVLCIPLPNVSRQPMPDQDIWGPRHRQFASDDSCDPDPPPVSCVICSIGLCGTRQEGRNQFGHGPSRFSLAKLPSHRVPNRSVSFGPSDRRRFGSRPALNLIQKYALNPVRIDPSRLRTAQANFLRLVTSVLLGLRHCQSQCRAC